MTILELREKRAKAWAAAKAFLDSHRNEKGVLSAEDDAAYTRMEKDILNQEEVIVFFGLSRRKFYKLLKEGKGLPFMARYGTSRLIIRTEFEKYLKAHPELRRRA